MEDICDSPVFHEKVLIKFAFAAGSSLAGIIVILIIVISANYLHVCLKCLDYSDDLVWCIGLIIGYAFEKAFAKVLKILALHQLWLDVLLNFVLLIVVWPAWRHYILPTVLKEEHEAKEHEPSDAEATAGMAQNEADKQRPPTRSAPELRETERRASLSASIRKSRTL